MGKQREKGPPGDGGTPLPGPGSGDEPQPVFPIHEHIGRQLKTLFEEVSDQPVPDKLRRLLEELEKKESEG
jgi:hypothetical protein